VYAYGAYSISLALAHNVAATRIVADVGVELRMQMLRTTARAHWRYSELSSEEMRVHVCCLRNHQRTQRNHLISLTLTQRIVQK